MKKLQILCILSFLFSCQQENGEQIKNNTDSIRTVVMETDRMWSATAGKIGYNKSRVQFADEHAINIMNGEMPLTGIKKISDYAATHPDTGFTISWHPVKCEISSAGDIGFTYGGWTVNTKNKSGRDTTLFGNYLTVWKKQSDGSWKYLADGGGSTPQEIMN